MNEILTYSGPDLATRQAVLAGSSRLEEGRYYYGYSAEVSELDRRSRRVRFVMNEETTDRGLDKISVAGYRFESFRLNPVMPWCHNYVALPVGSWDPDTVKVSGIQLVGEAEFVEADENPFAEFVYKMYLRRHLRACSVGIQPISWQWARERSEFAIDHHEQHLVECSACVIGQHPKALVTNAAADGIDVRPYVAMCRRVLDEHGDGLLVVERKALEQVARAEGSRSVFEMAGAVELYRSLRPNHEPAKEEPDMSGSQTKAAEGPPESPALAGLELKCPSCGEEHPVELKQLSKPEPGGPTHWGACSTTSDPVRFHIRSEAAELEARKTFMTDFQQQWQKRLRAAEAAESGAILYPPERSSDAATL